MPTTTEKQAFSKRLALALRRTSPRIEGATKLADAMAVLYKDGVTVQTAHKWLTGQALPSAEKTTLLAEWLNVNEHWLRYGPATNTGKDKTKKISTPPSEETLNLARQIEALDSHQRYLVEELVGQLFDAAVR